MTTQNFFRELKTLMRDSEGAGNDGQAMSAIKEIKNVGQGCTAAERAAVVGIGEAVRKFIHDHNGCVYDQCAPGQTPPVTQVPDAMKKDIKDMQFKLSAAKSKCQKEFEEKEESSGFAVVPLSLLSQPFDKELERLGIPVEEGESQEQRDQDPQPQIQNNQVEQPVPQPQVPPQPQRRPIPPQAVQNNPQNTRSAGLLSFLRGRDPNLRRNENRLRGPKK